VVIVEADIEIALTLDHIGEFKVIA